VIESTSSENSEQVTAAELTARINAMEDRLSRLEETLRLLVPAEKLPQSPPIEPIEKVEVTPPQVPPALVVPEEPPAAPKEIGLEAKIGSYWLNRIGLAALLIGIISLLLYSFQYFGAGLKIGFGFILAAGIVYLSRSPRMDAKTPWFAHGLNALGWSIAFFCGYAMYFISDLKLINSPLIELATLGGLSAGMMYDAIRSKSEFTASLSAVFAALSICLATAAVNPFIALLIILAAATYVAVRQHWYGLLLWATIAFYAAFASSFHEMRGAADLSVAAILLGGWMLVHGALYFAKETTDVRKDKLVAASLLNGLLGSFYASLVLERSHVNAELSHTAPFAGLGIIYLATAYLFRRTTEPLWTLHLLMGLSFVNVAMFGKLSGAINAVSAIVQVGLLSSIGLLYKIPAFRWFAAVLAIAIAPEIFSNEWQIGTLATAVYGAVTYLYWKHAASEVAGSGELALFGNFYLTMTNIFAAAVINDSHLETGWKGVLYTVQLIANSGMALRTASTYVRVIASIMLLLSVPSWLTNTSRENALPTLVAVVLLYGFAAYCRTFDVANPTVKNFKIAFGTFATLLLTVLILTAAPNSWLSIATCVEGMTLIAAGFWLKEKLIRIAGLIVFAIMLVHLLFFDLASAPTIARIVSFIVTGLILVGCSYGYGWFSKKFE
jgi:hypothetical protein